MSPAVIIDRLFMVTALALAAAALIAWAAAPARSQTVPQSHTGQPDHWYSPSCCSLNDCEPLAAEAVEDVSGGWHVHYLAKRGLAVDVFVRNRQERDSLDARFHGCATPIRFLCLYVPRVS